MKKFSLIFIFLLFSTFSIFSQNLTISEIYNTPELRGAHISRIHWCFDNKSLIYYANKDGEKGYFLFDLERKMERSFIDFNLIKEKINLKDGKIGEYKLSRDGNIFIFTASGKTYLYDTKMKNIETMPIKGNISYIYFSPDENYISYIKDCNLFIYNLKDKNEIQITNDGSEENIYGRWDWVYEEELDLSKGTFWSSDSRFLIFVNLKEKNVRNYPLIYTKEKGRLKLQKYPYAGENNPPVKIFIFDLLTREKKEIYSVDGNSYIARIYPDRDGEFLYLVELNREQNHLKLVKINLNTLKTQTILEESYKTWININNIFYLFKNNKDFLWGSERDGFLHIYFYDITNKKIKKITRGSWAVTALLGVDEENKKIYFTSSMNNPLESHLYSVDFKGKTLEKITSKEGWHKVIGISPDFKYYIDNYSSTLFPDVIYLKSFKNESEKYILNGKELNLETTYNLREPVFKSIQKNGIKYYTEMFLPQNFDKNKKYPVLIYVYGGPHYQVVKKGWKFTTTLFNEYMAQNGIIVFSLDNRGSTNRGKEWEDWIYHNFGKYEIEDQLIGVNYLKSLPYVDGSRIGIWGWSYGGYMTLFALTKAPNIFKCGVSVAPVTDWKLYDSIYTERYMGLPKNNRDGYIESSPINFVKYLKSPLLICFGTSDDNVHPVNSLTFIDKLIENNKNFSVYIFPNQSHSISKKKDRIFLFKRISNFLFKNLKR